MTVATVLERRERERDENALFHQMNKQRDFLSDVIKRDDGWRFYANKLSVTYAAPTLSHTRTHTHPPISGSKQGFLFGANDTNPCWLFTFSVGVSWLIISGPSVARNTNEACTVRLNRMSKGGRWVQFSCRHLGGANYHQLDFFEHKHYIAGLRASLVIGNCVNVWVQPFRHQVESYPTTQKLIFSNCPLWLQPHLSLGHALACFFSVLLWCEAQCWSPSKHSPQNLFI